MLKLNDDQVAVAHADRTHSIQTYEEAQKFFSKPGRAHVTIFSLRPGALDLVTSMEELIYPVGTMENELFDVRMIEWHDVIWVIVSFPEYDLDRIKRLAAANGLRIEEQVPVMLGGKNGVTFPFTFTKPLMVLNTKNHPMYK